MTTLRFFPSRLLVSLAILLMLSVPVTSHAYRECRPNANQRTEVRIPPDIIISPNTQAGSAIWNSQEIVTSMTCTSFDPNKQFDVLIAYMGSPGFTMPPEINVMLVWSLIDNFPSLNLKPNRQLYKDNVNTSFVRNTGFPGIFRDPSPLYVSVSWRVYVTKGSNSKPSSSSLAALPSSYSLLQFSDLNGRDANSSSLTLLGLDTLHVAQPTCTVTALPGNAITLPTVSRIYLGDAGRVAGETPFEVSIRDCGRFGPFQESPLGITVRPYFQSPLVDPSTGNLRSTGNNSAHNVQLQLLNRDGSVINLAAPSGSQGANTDTLRFLSRDSAGADLKYLVRYITVGGPAGSGPVNSTVSLTLDYP